MELGQEKQSPLSNVRGEPSLKTAVWKMEREEENMKVE
jgi:hypothetical protein